MKNRLIKELIGWAKAVGFSAVICLLLMLFARPTLVSGDSMSPTLKDKDFGILERYSYFLTKPNYGDIVRLNSEIDWILWLKKPLIKRVIALEGDTIAVTNEGVFVNGRMLNEPYIKEQISFVEFKGIVPKDSVFVMGDNRNNSLDSRNSLVGFVPIHKITGKLYMRLFPFGDIRKF